jgi:hypothetical protein
MWMDMRYFCIEAIGATSSRSKARDRVFVVRAELVHFAGVAAVGRDVIFVEVVEAVLFAVRSLEARKDKGRG